MPPRRTRRSGSRSKRSSRSRSRSRAAQRSQSKRRSQQRRQQREQRANVREAARRPVTTKTSQRQPGLAASTSAKTMAPALKANRLEKEFKTASDDRKKQIVKELKNTRSELNRLNKEQSFLDLRKAAAGAGVPGLVARTSDGTIITDSSGNPIMTTKGREVFDQTRGGFRGEAGRLLQESPELYKRMYPVQYGLQKGLPKIAQAMIPGGTILKNIAKSAFGKAQDVGSGIMGSKIGQDIAAAPKGFFGDLKTMLGGVGNLFGGLGNFIPRGRAGDSIQAERSSGGAGGGDRGGVIDAAQSVVDNIYGTRIGVTGPVTADFRDSDGDGVDDRYQTGPGMKYQGPETDPSQLKNPFQNPPKFDTFDSSFQVAQPVVTQPFEQFNRGTPFNYSVSPLSNQYTQQGIAAPNLAQYYQNLNFFPRAV